MRPHRRVRRTLGAALALGLVCATTAAAQIQHGGEPPSSWRRLESVCPTCELPAVDVQALRIEDARRGKDAPFRFAELIPVELGLENAGVWEDLGNGDRVWRLRVESHGALSVMLTFSRFQLPVGGELFVYGDERNVIRGAYTHLNNQANGQFAIQPTAGDALTLEYFEPGDAEVPGEITLSGVLHDYRGILTKGGSLGKSGTCNVDVACPPGAGWEDQADATVLIMSSGRCCSGVLLNNTNNDATPFILTARHCGDMTNAVFQFNWKRPRCGGGQPQAQSDTIQGSTRVVRDIALDFQLVRLSAQIPAAYGPYFAGWDRTGDVPASTTVLHHPKGDAMKISIDVDAPVVIGPAWKIRRWETGTTEPGSSGAALFTPEQLFVGWLVAGRADCTTPVQDFFVRLDAIWSLVAPFLDSAGTGTTKLAGLDPSVNPPLPFSVQGVSPANVQPLIPGTAQTLAVDGSGITQNTTLDFDGTPLPSTSYSYFSNSRITLDMPQVPTGQHTITVHEGSDSFDVGLEVVEASGPIFQGGNGEPGNLVTTFSGIDLLWADKIGHVVLCFWSTSNLPSVHPLATLGLGNQFSELNFCALVTIPGQGWVQGHSSIPGGLRQMTVYSQSLCLSCLLTNPGQQIPVSNLQSAFVPL